MPNTMKEYRKRYITQAKNNTERLRDRIKLLDSTMKNLNPEVSLELTNCIELSHQIESTLDVILSTIIGGARTD